jgi:isocitrate/isopropylmalate dehydrogenase
VEEEVRKHPDLTYEHYYIDNLASQILRTPREFDIIVTSNLFGDIISDEAAELIGGFAMVSDGFVGGRVAYFASIPIYGSPPKDSINPTGTLLAARMMLDYLKMHQEAEALERAIAAVYKEGEHLTYDQGGKATTKEFVDAILRKL